MLKFFRDYVGMQASASEFFALQSHDGHPHSDPRTQCEQAHPVTSSALLFQVPLHFREDFSGTSLISAAWCKTDVRRTALGVDIDREALEWGWKHNGQAMLSSAPEQLCLVEANVGGCPRHDTCVSKPLHHHPLLTFTKLSGRLMLAVQFQLLPELWV